MYVSFSSNVTLKQSQVNLFLLVGSPHAWSSVKLPTGASCRSPKQRSSHALYSLEHQLTTVSHLPASDSVQTSPSAVHRRRQKQHTQLEEGPSDSTKS